MADAAKWGGRLGRRPGKIQISIWASMRSGPVSVVVPAVHRVDDYLTERDL